MQLQNWPSAILNSMRFAQNNSWTVMLKAYMSEKGMPVSLCQGNNLCTVLTGCWSHLHNYIIYIKNSYIYACNVACLHTLTM